MKNLKKSKNLLLNVKDYDDIKLSRVKDLGITLFDLLKDYLPVGLLEDIKDIDNLSNHKKRAFIDYLIKVVEETENSFTKYSQSSIKNKKEEKKIKTEQLDRNYFKRLSLDDLKILKPIEKRAFKKIGLDNVENALYNFPRKYEDRRIKSISKVRNEEKGTFIATVDSAKKVNKGRLKTEIVLKEGKSQLYVYFVHDKPFLFNFFKKGKKVKIFGKVTIFNGKKSIVQPEIFKISDNDNINTERIVPVYSLKGDSSIKITSQTMNHLRRGMYKIVEKYAPFYPEILPEYILEKYKLPEVKTALKNIHFPDNKEDIKKLEDFDTRYQKRFIFEELFLLQLAQFYRKYLFKRFPSVKIEVEDDFIENFEKHLPFKLTNAQKRTIKEILNDMNKTVPMNRMVQGDVGSGKTVVAAAAALAAVKNGKQVAVMAPTEILAQQHYNSFKNFLENFGVNVVLLTGSIPQKEKNKIYKELEEGKAEVVIGTHALIQEKVKFKNLALVIVDEQHRFGVEQRKALTEKANIMLHTLVMTATPIPRTLTLTYFADLDVSKLDELPAGRKPVETVLLFDDERKILYKKIEEELKKGRQVFVVYPLIEESEKMDLKSAEEGFKHWQEAFPDRKVLLLHGKMKQEEKDRIMNEFKEGKADILVSTTVIEVGVDIPNASVMVIEEAHRFGLSQIHQLRGRIGRGEHKSYCFLIAPSSLRKPSPKPDEESRRRKTLERLKIIVKTSDGFKIAEEDWKLRGGGDIGGTAQSGKFNFRIADFQRPKDEIILKYAKLEAENLIKEDPDLENYPELKNLLFDRYGDRFDLFNVA